MTAKDEYLKLFPLAYCRRFPAGWGVCDSFSDEPAIVKLSPAKAWQAALEQKRITKRITTQEDSVLKIGSKVRIKQNAFSGSDDPKDIEARGKTGEIVQDDGVGCWGVRLDNSGKIWPLLEEELEALD